MTLTPIF